MNPLNHITQQVLKYRLTPNGNGAIGIAMWRATLRLIATKSQNTNSNNIGRE